MRLLFLATLLPALALATPPPKTKRISALIVPMDKASEGEGLKIETYANETLQEYDGFELKTSDDLFGVAKDENATASLKRSEQGFSEGKDAFTARNYEDAERKLRATIKEYGKAVPAMGACAHLCDAVAMYAASLQARGDVEEAKIATLDLLALNATFDLDRKVYPQAFLSLKAQVATGRTAQLRGNVNVKSKPAGARVYLNGEFKGYTPMTLATLPIGKALVKVEKPGFQQVGSMVDVSAEDQDVVHELTATQGFKAYDSLQDRLAGEALKSKGGATLSTVGKTLGIDRAVVGVLKSLEEGGTELTLAYFDLKSGQRLSQKRATFQGDEYGQLKGELGRMVNSLINSAGTSAKVSRSGDPLDNSSGMEEWDSEDRGGRRTSKEKKKRYGDDPLDSASGTEDW